ncbi:MAG: membrane protein insertase YidC, partial [Erythrobacter sp.]|nr:membrane protein insertase YidC [Erythrobacter sp.]
MNNSRNLILAVVLSALLLFGWDAAMGWLYPQPVEVQQAEKVDTPAENAALANNGAVEAGPVARRVDLATALRGGNRVRIDAPRVQGSINLEGARIDDLVLKDYRESTEEGADYVRLFSP